MLRSRAAEGNALIVAVLVLCWVFVCLRVYVRTCMAKAFGADDWLLLVALALFTVYCSFGLASIAHGAGKDPSQIPHSDFPSALLFWWLALLFYNPTTLFVRLSISVFIHKLCISRTHKIIIWVTMILSIIFSIFYFFITLLQCNPPSYFWTKYSGANGVCVDDKILPASTYAHSAVSAVGDWILGLLPIWLIWDLQMGRRTKVSVGILLGLGILAGVAAIIRIPYVRILGDKKQFLYNVIDVSIWSFTEAALGIIAASASALRPLFRKFYELSTSHTRSQSHHLHPIHASRGKSRQLTSNTGRHENGTFYKEDDSSLELGMTSRVGVNVEGVERGPESRSGSEENLTGVGLGNNQGKGDIHVRTVIEVARERERGSS